MIGTIKRIAICIVCAIFVVLFTGALILPPASGAIGNMQTQDVSKPIVWSATAERISASEAMIELRADIKEGWHLYGFRMPEDGPMPTDIRFSLPKGVKLIGKLKPSQEVVRRFDDMFDCEVEFWSGKEIVFTQKLAIGSSTGSVSVRCEVSYMGCDDNTCLPYRQLSFNVIVPEK